MLSTMNANEIRAIVILVITVGTFGWVALRMLRDGARRVSEVEAYELLKSANSAAQNGKSSDALLRFREAEERHPTLQGNADFQSAVACLCLVCAEPREAMTRVGRALDAVGDNAAYSIVVDAFCSTVLSLNVTELHLEAEKLLRETIRLVPNDLALKATLGGLLCEMGREEEGNPLLILTHAAPPDQFNRGINAAYLSVIASHRGNAEDAKRFREEALTIMPDHPIVRRLLGVPGPGSEHNVALR
jgi:hypothetical protein